MDGSEKESIIPLPRSCKRVHGNSLLVWKIFWYGFFTLQLFYKKSGKVPSLPAKGVTVSLLQIRSFPLAGTLWVYVAKVTSVAFDADVVVALVATVVALVAETFYLLEKIFYPRYRYPYFNSQPTTLMPFGIKLALASVLEVCRTRNKIRKMPIFTVWHILSF